MESPLQELFLIAVGVVFGFMNTAASSGTAISLPALFYLGFSPAVANATNRIPLLIGFAMAAFNFHRAGAIDWKRTFRMIFPVAVGAAIGALFIGQLSGENIKILLAIALGISLGLLALNPRRMIAKWFVREKKITPLSYLIMVGIGIWGGLIVLDTAAFLLFALIFNQGLDIIKANAIKSILCLTVGIVSAAIFAFNGSVDVIAGAWLSVGSIVGSYAGSQFALKESSRKWIFRLITAIILFDVIRLVVEVVMH